jgi:hypothetical protein
MNCWFWHLIICCMDVQDAVSKRVLNNSVSHICDDCTKIDCTKYFELDCLWFKFSILMSISSLCFWNFCQGNLQVLYQHDLIHLYEITIAASFPGTRALGHCTQLKSARSGHCLARLGTARQCYTCSKNIYFVRRTLSIAGWYWFDKPSNNLSQSFLWSSLFHCLK